MPIRLGDPQGQKGKTTQDGDGLAASARGEKHLKSSSRAVKSSQEQKLPLPHLPALQRAEPSTIHHAKHCR